MKKTILMIITPHQQYTLESSFNAINITNTTMNNAQNKNNYWRYYQFNSIDGHLASTASAISLSNNNQHSEIPNYTNDAYTFKDGKGYKIVTQKRWENTSKKRNETKKK